MLRLYYTGTMVYASRDPAVADQEVTKAEVLDMLQSGKLSNPSSAELVLSAYDAAVADALANKTPVPVVAKDLPPVPEVSTSKHIVADYNLRALQELMAEPGAANYMGISELESLLIGSGLAKPETLAGMSKSEIVALLQSSAKAQKA